MSQSTTVAAHLSAEVSVEEGTKRGTATARIPTKVQTAIARRMAEVRATVPTWTASVDVDVETLTEALSGDVRLVDAVIRAAGIALVEHPRVNGTWRDGKIEVWTQPNVALAIDPDGESIALPTVRDAGNLVLTAIAERRLELEGKVRDNGLRAPDTAGATFALIDGGADGADRFDAIMPPGVGGALAIGRPQRRPWVVGDEIAPRHVVTLTLTADHRAIYPSHGGPFLRKIEQLLSEPSRLLGA